MRKNFNEDTIAAVSTPPGEGGIGIIRISGRSAIRIADNIFFSPLSKKRPSRFKTHTVNYGYITEKRRAAPAKGKKSKTSIKRGDIIDEVLLTVMRAPRTYTKEDIVEINCHGGAVALRRVLELIVNSGARPAEPGEFTKRAFLNGRIDLAQAEAVLDVIKAKTSAGLRASVGQLGGALSREISSARSGIIGLRSDIEAEIDFPEEDTETGNAKSRLKKIKAAARRVEKLAETYRRGVILKEGIRAVICGRANVGKSSLMNLLLNRDRVIVTRLPGTTRDAIEETVNIKGIPVRLVDTAGIRKRHGVLEKEGISKSRLYISAADIVLCVLDGSEGLKKDDKALLKELKDKHVIVLINKRDRKSVLSVSGIKKISGNKDIIEISCLAKIGIDKLEDKIYNEISGGGIYSSGELMLNNARHKDAIDRSAFALRRAAEAARRGLSGELLSVDIREAIDALGEITGEHCAEDVLDIIFSRFCIGK